MTTPKISRTEKFAILQNKALLALNGPVTINNYAAVKDFRRFLDANLQLEGRCRPMIGRVNEYLDGNKQEVQELSEAHLWSRFSTSYRHMAANRDVELKEFAKHITDAIEGGHSMGHIFTWSDKSFVAAAERDVALEIAMFIDSIDGTIPSVNFARVKAYIQKEAMARGGRGARSTSPTSNRMEDAVREAWFSALDRVAWHA